MVRILGIRDIEVLENTSFASALLVGAGAAQLPQDTTVDTLFCTKDHDSCKCDTCSLGCIECGSTAETCNKFSIDWGCWVTTTTNPPNTYAFGDCTLDGAIQ